MAAKRAQQAKQSLASSSNLSTLTSAASAPSNTSKLGQNRSRLKSTSMTNLLAANNSQNSSSQHNLNKIHRPASRNALDSIHKGMNAKFTHVQSKVLLQNIRPQQQQTSSSKIPAKTPLERLQPATPSSTLRRSTPSSTPTPGGKIQQSDRSQLINRIKSLQDELERHEQRADELKQELERERADKTEQVQQAKLELQERVAESERQADEYHQKLLEAYELADANRRAADSVLSESRQREEELRKKIDELEQQLVELREFVAMKDEMSSKMSELREQIRSERERYEEKTRTLHQMFENEKIRLEMELMEKVKQVGESYELNKLKTQNRTIELDARLSSERLFATKVRLHQVNQDNEKLNKQLRNTQQHLRELEKKLLLTETMLRQFVDNSSSGGTPKVAERNVANNKATAAANLNETPLAATRQRLTGSGGGSTSRGGKLKPSAARSVRFGGGGGGGGGGGSAKMQATQPPAPIDRPGRQLDGDSGADPAARSSSSGSLEMEAEAASAGQRNRAQAQAQTQPPTSRARTIINDLRQRLNFGGGGGGGGGGSNRAPGDPLRDSSWKAPDQQSGRADVAIQANQAEYEDDDGEDDQDDLDTNSMYDLALDGRHYEEAAPIHFDRLIDEPPEIMIRRRRRSISLDAFLNNSIVKDVGDQRLIISRGWPPAAMRRHRRHHQARRDSHPQRRPRGLPSDHHNTDFDQHHHHQHHQRRRRASSLNGRLLQGESPSAVRSNELGYRRRQSAIINDFQKRRLLIEYLKQNPGEPLAGGSGRKAASDKDKLAPPRATGTRRLSIVQKGHSPTQLIVQYDLPVHDSKKPIVVGQEGKRERVTGK